MNDSTIRIRIWMIAAVLLTVVGCGTSPPPTFYQLEEHASTQLSGLERGIAIGVGPINVATYLDRPQIVIRGEGHQLQLSEFHRWVEPLTDSISRVIIVNLSNSLGSTRVYKIPRRDIAIPLDFRVEIDIARFDGVLGGDAVLVSRWTIYDRRDNAQVTKVSIIRESSGAEGFDALIAAQNRALQNLSQEIVASLKKIR